jgi:hypothetical protein
MFINGTKIESRHNRPSVLNKVGLVVYFLNDGTYQDPYEISAVSIFRASKNFYPSSVVATNGQIKPEASSLVLANFSNSAALTTDTVFDASNYSPGSTGIFRLREGVYAVVLDPSIVNTEFNLSGIATIPYDIQHTGEYLDVWTIRRVSGSILNTVPNKFNLYDDRFYAITEPVLFRVATRLVTKHIVLGSKVPLKFTNEVTLENNKIDQSIYNLFKESFILNPSVEIYKENNDRNLPARVLVSSISDTSSLCDVTSDNTVIYSFDTSTLQSHPEFLAGRFGSLTGTYVARLRFETLNEIHYSNYFAFIVG